jgi:hypothetical protein
MALQHGVGILPERRVGFGAARFDRPCGDGKTLAEGKATSGSASAEKLSRPTAPGMSGANILTHQLAAGREEIFQQKGRLVCENSGCHLGAMIELRVIEHRETRADRAAFGIVRSVNHPRNPGLYDRAGAHRTRLDRNVEGGPRKTMISDDGCSSAKGDDFGVRGWVAVFYRAVSGGRYDAVADN